eukprot:CAMPEP_0170077946 /NCGR_PEP_ID=MMETSP0019_2-20121128/14637_1 /TAXON_ID=98059 /ORGANISM="Dinobryon sp., Strain UTEXLB2267" /LENGTH=265 /DNA_ID=CAMNT_0010290531 /DNA_START=264 /DNA_END=1064 /DNA_ORIENTATION=-
MQFDNLKYLLQQGSIDAYDGFRLIVQKQVNLNTVVVHTYWLGSQATGGQPFYRYRLVLPFDEKVVSVQTDLDFNIEGDVKYPITKNVNSKVNFAFGEQQNQVSMEVETTDDCSATQLQMVKSDESSLSLGYMQSITPALSLGGSGLYSFKSRTLQTAIGGLFTHGDNTVAAQWDNNLRVFYLRRVNPNRVHLTTDLVVDENGATQMSVGAEYTLKQSKLHMSVDSNLLIKSTVETTVAPGVMMQFTAEVCQVKSSYRFGYGIIMG